MSPLLTFDVGNTRTKVALFDRDTLPSGGKPICLAHGILNLDHERGSDWLRDFHPALASEPVMGVVAATRPRNLGRLNQLWPREWPALLTVSNVPEFPLLVTVRQPRRVGIDRLLNALAADRLREPRQSVLIIDTGTALTIDLLSADGAFAGGTILPGLELSAHALADYTESLPLIPIGQLSEEPNALGRDTGSAIHAGLFWGHLGAVREIVFRLTAQLPPNSSAPLIVLTGGGASALAPYLPRVHQEPHLTMQGLAVAWRHLREH